MRDNPFSGFIGAFKKQEIFPLLEFCFIYESLVRSKFLKIKEITSRQNSTVLWAASLAEKKYREKHRAFLVEGIKLVTEALSSALPVTHIFLHEEKRDEYYAVIHDLCRGTVGDGVEIFILSAPCFEKISTEKAPQGVIAAVKYLDFFKRLDKINSDEVSSRAVFLSSVRDPQNLGAIIRSAAAFGTETVILSEDSADIYHPRVLRSAMGSLFRMQVLTVSDEIETVRALRGAGRRVFAAELREHACALSSLSLRSDDVFMIGNEGHGIAPWLSAECDGSVYIPISAGVESLNASVAASVLLWEQSKCKK